ncbi:MAG TPA: sigma-54 dependent transcriptional regulator [bacterium]|nr:sigma-54 dependent transcriptional regulator [bacterium]HOL47230.1 sigma-54 dependent transcriptional regulator [bacterium]HPQ18261.1 sigma-54 dependent transcriptional regulator [bacterium]
MDSILIIDDDESIIESFYELFKNKYIILSAQNSNDAIRIIKEKKVDLIFLDYRLPDIDGLTLLQKIKEIEDDILIIMITAYGSYETIIQAISSGAYDYIEKPLDIDKINILTKRALETKKMKNYVKIINEEQINNYNIKRIIGKSAVMQEIFKIIGKVVNNDVNVLITGESGTGKELVARAIHFNSPRKNEPFIAVNCSALSENLLDNELFGHEAQAFTGAISSKMGKFEIAGEGTIFLDEIGDMPLSIQSKLLRVIQEKEFNRLGGTKTIKLKARIITATNKNLLEKINEGSFRNDLFYRINVATIDLPPLRKRKEDIPLLIDYFINNLKNKLKKNILGISNNALELLVDYDWPGNVRELENVLTNVCINLNKSIIEENDISPYLLTHKKNKNIIEEFVDKYLELNSDNQNIFPDLVEKLEKLFIEKVGQKLNYNKSAMAKILGISRITLQKKLSENINE